MCSSLIVIEDIYDALVCYVKSSQHAHVCYEVKKSLYIKRSLYTVQTIRLISAFIPRLPKFCL